jgi:hypothetical protein
MTPRFRGAERELPTLSRGERAELSFCFVFIDIPASFLPPEPPALSLGERVSTAGAFISRRATGEGLFPSEMGRKKHLARTATAGENAVAGHPLPKGEG